MPGRRVRARLIRERFRDIVITWLGRVLMTREEER
jgi:hypothetical protein